MKKLVLIVSCLIFGNLACIAQDFPWTIPGDDSGFEYNMNVCGIVKIDNIEQFSETLAVGAFIGDECRGATYPYEYEGHIEYWLTILGNPDETFTFKLYDSEHGIVLDLNCTCSVDFEIDGMIGLDEYFIFSFTTPTPQPPTYTLYIPGYGAGNTGGYYLISSPVTEPITPSDENGFLTENYDLYYFDQTQTLEWINFEAGAFDIESGKGYLYANETGTTLQFTGTPYNANGVIALEYYDTNPDNRMHGWNLIGNPFPDENGATINRACYVMNTYGTELAPAASGTLIPAMNGVFVKAEAEGESVTFTPSSTPTDVAQVVLNVLKDRAATLDRAIVCFDENSTLPKFMLDSNNTKVYIPESGEQFAVVSSARQNSLPVNFKAKESGTYTLSVDINNIEMEYLHLIDNMTGADIDLLQQPNYQFNASTYDYESRFMLVFRAETGVEEQGQESFCFVNGRSLYFCEDVEDATLILVDMTGRMVRNETLKGNGVSLDNLSEGVYVVRLAKGNDMKTQKIVVR